MECALMLRHNTKEYVEKRKSDYKTEVQKRQSAKPISVRKKELLKKLEK